MSEDSSPVHEHGLEHPELDEASALVVAPVEDTSWADAHIAFVAVNVAAAVNVAGLDDHEGGGSYMLGDPWHLE